MTITVSTNDYYCGFVFKTADVFDTPELVGTTCGYTDDDLDSFNFHKENHNKLFCYICGNEIKYARSLRTHIKRCLKDKRHKCSKCRKRFVTNVEKINHEFSMHDIGTKRKIKTYSCETCDKTATKTDYVDHLLTNIHRRRTGDTIEMVKIKYPDYDYGTCIPCNYHSVQKSKMKIHFNRKKCGMNG